MKESEREREKEREKKEREREICVYDHTYGVPSFITCSPKVNNPYEMEILISPQWFSYRVMAYSKEGLGKKSLVETTFL